jgi:hypothetical protein
MSKRKARELLRKHGEVIALHALYQFCGLPTAELKDLPEMKALVRDLRRAGARRRQRRFTESLHLRAEK